MIDALKTRLLLGAAAFIALALLVAAAGLTLLFERHVKDWIDAELNAHLDQLIAGVDRDPSGAVTVVRPPADPRFETPLSGLYWQVTFQNGGDVRSRSLWDFTLALPLAQGIDEQSHHQSIAGPDGQSLYLMQRNVELPARLGHAVARFAVGRDEAGVDAAVWRFAQALAPFLLILAGLLIVAAWLQVSIGLRPLAAVRTRIADIRSGRSARLGTKFPVEVQPLAREIDTLLDARDKQIETARQRAADLAHGLKTPLQVLSGGIAKIRAGGDSAVADDLEQAAHMMQRHVDRQLARARMQNGNALASAGVADVASRVIRVLERTPLGQSRAWSLEVPEGSYARIHADDLAEALGGLAENAAKYARARVVVSASGTQDWITVTVSDDGPGIPSQNFGDVLQRGGRLDTSGSGTGLGLAIVSDIAEAWGGVVELDNSGGLFNVHLRLPRASSAPAN